MYTHRHYGNITGDVTHTDEEYYTETSFVSSWHAWSFIMLRKIETEEVKKKKDNNQKSNIS